MTREERRTAAFLIVLAVCVVGFLLYQHAKEPKGEYVPGPSVASTTCVDLKQEAVSSLEKEADRDQAAEAQDEETSLIYTEARLETQRRAMSDLAESLLGASPATL
jgi:hypothetical protein